MGALLMSVTKRWPGSSWRRAILAAAILIGLWLAHSPARFLARDPGSDRRWLEIGVRIPLADESARWTAFVSLEGGVPEAASRKAVAPEPDRRLRTEAGPAPALFRLLGRLSSWWLRSVEETSGAQRPLERM